MGNSQQVAPPGEKPARRCAIPPALRGGSLSPLCLSFVKRPVRTRMRGVVGAGEGDLPGYPISWRSVLSLRQPNSPLLWVLRTMEDGVNRDGVLGILVEDGVRKTLHQSSTIAFMDDAVCLGITADRLHACL